MNPVVNAPLIMLMDFSHKFRVHLWCIKIDKVTILKHACLTEVSPHRTPQNITQVPVK